MNLLELCRAAGYGSAIALKAETQVHFCERGPKEFLK
jgi:hypothetical protein